MVVVPILIRMQEDVFQRQKVRIEIVSVYTRLSGLKV